MGFRLDGPHAAHASGADIISDATPIGALQVPGSGQPILLMADRQTTGGYPRIATVITADLGIAGQLAPGDRSAFASARPPKRLSALIARENALLAVEAAVGMSDFVQRLEGRFGEERVRRDVPLAPYTTFQVGGPADWLVEPRSGDEIVAALEIAHESRVAVTLLGGGSNVLIADAGVRGLVIRPRGGDDSARRPTHVRADAAVTINGLVRWTIVHGAAGLEAWAGTPGTVGGAIFGNAHFGGRLIGELVDSRAVWPTRDGRRSDGARERDGVRLRSKPAAGHRRNSAVGDFSCPTGDPAELRAIARESLAFRKRTQPLDTPSAGCVFQNPERAAIACPTAFRGRPARSSIAPG